jgi:copper chaperone
MSTQTFPVTGLTCGHCVGAVTSELSVLAGVTDVHIHLVVEGTSTLSVTTDKELTASR